MKILQSICDKSTMIDDKGKPFKLYFYNPILGGNYLVKVIDFQPSMSRETNRIHQYSLRLKAVAPLESVRNFNLSISMSKVLISDNLQKAGNIIVNKIRSSLLG
jgi:hypothetical protein